MTTYEMLAKAIDAKKKRGALTEAYIASTKAKMDVFLMADRINEEEYTMLSSMMEI